VAEGVAINSTGTDVYVTGDSFDAATPSGEVFVVDPADNTVTDTISLGAGTEAQEVVVNPSNGDIFVGGNSLNSSTHTFDGTVWEIDPSTNTVVNTFDLGNSGAESQLTGLAVDPTNGDVYVTDEIVTETPGSDPPSTATETIGGTVSVIDPITKAITSFDTGDAAPLGVAYDPANGDIYLSEGTFTLTQNEPETVSGALAELNPATNVITSVHNFGTGTVPLGLGVDPSNGELSVLEEIINLGANPPTTETATFAVSEINSANTVDDIIQVPGVLYLGELGLAVNPSSGDVYLPTVEPTSGGAFDGEILVIDPANNTVITDDLGNSIEPTGLAVDPSGAEAGDIYVAEDDGGQGGLSVIPASG
jgi:DNA-binding beta-propeller fold protein YncE